MYAITDQSGVVLAVSETLGHQANGNAVVHGGALNIAAVLVGREYSNVDPPVDYEDGKYRYDGTTWTLITDELADAQAALELLGYTEVQ